MIFALYSAFGVLLITLLALNVSRLRIVRRIANGDGGSREMKAAIRAHMNSVEHVLPFGLLVLALEQMRPSSTSLALLAAGFLIVRAAHAGSMITSSFNVRRWAAGLTYLAELAGVAWIVAAFGLG